MANYKKSGWLLGELPLILIRPDIPRLAPSWAKSGNIGPIKAGGAGLPAKEKPAPTVVKPGTQLPWKPCEWQVYLRGWGWASTSGACAMPEWIQAPAYCVTISWLAKRLGVNRKTISSQLKRPEAPPPILVGARHKWLVTDITKLFPGLVHPHLPHQKQSN